MTKVVSVCSTKVPSMDWPLLKTTVTLTASAEMVVASATLPSAMLDPNLDNAKKLVRASKGRVRTVLALTSATATVAENAALGSDVATAITKGQALGEWAADTLYAPVLVLIEGKGYTDAAAVALPDLTEGTDNRVGVVIGQVMDGDTAVGSLAAVIAGRIAKIPVQRHIGRVRDGALKIQSATIDGTVEIADAFSLPELLSAGFTYKWKNRMIGADVSYQTWSKASFFGEKNGLDRLSASMGFMIRPDESSKNLFKRSSYQLGLNYSQPYFKVGDNKGPMQLGVSAGISFPINTAYNSMSYLHISGEYVRVEPMAKGMITENYLRINIGVTFMERWFMKLMVD